MFLDLNSNQDSFAIIGDVHGCYDELLSLLDLVEGRRIIFVGDFADRGPLSAEVLSLAMKMHSSGRALSVIGNHDDKLRRYLKGNPIRVSYSLSGTIESLDERSEDFRSSVLNFLESLPHQIIIDDSLVVAHAGIKEDLIRVDNRDSRECCLYGPRTDEKDESGVPIRSDWAQDYKGEHRIVYGHHVVVKSEWVNNTIDIDTGCVHGGCLTALLYPELELVSVPSKRVYFGSAEQEKQSRFHGQSSDS